MSPRRKGFGSVWTAEAERRKTFSLSVCGAASNTEVYLHDYATVTEAILGLKKYFLFYNADGSTSHWIIRLRRKCTKVRQTEASKPYAPLDLWSKPQWDVPRKRTRGRRKRN